MSASRVITWAVCSGLGAVFTIARLTGDAVELVRGPR